MSAPYNFVDLILFNARIYDPVEGFLPDTALAVFSNRILAVGSDEDILHLRQPHTTSIDADGRLLLPAFQDSHTHFLGYVKRQQEVSLYDCTSLQEALSRIEKKVNKTPEGEWVTGGGWNNNLWPESDYPTFRQLDSISTRHFIALDSKDWHTAWVNSPVLERIGVSTDRPYANAKHLAVNPHTGEFTGILEEDARLRVFDLVPPPTYQRLRKSWQQVTRDFHRLGFSGVHTVETPAEFKIYQEARRQGEMGLRMFWYLPIQHVGAAKELAIELGLGDDFLKIVGAKIFVDGAFGSQTAELLEDYLELGHSGVEVLTEQQLEADVAKAVEARLACAIHAIGDRAIRKTLRVLGKFAEQSRKYGLVHRIEHAQLIHPDDVPLFKKYGIVASVQPVHLAADIPIIQKYLGGRGWYAYPYATLLRHGAKLILGSDIPVETFNPWHAIYTAVERRFNLDPKEPSFYPEEKLDLPACLAGYTSNSAEVVGLGHRQGRIKAGALADFFLADRDVFSVSPEEMKSTQSVLTVVDGVVVYREIA